MLGICRIRLSSGMIINECAIFSKAGRSWIGLPNRYSIDATGKKSWKPYIEFETPEQTEAFKKQLDEACNKLLEKVNLSANEPQKNLFEEIPF